MAPAGSGRDRGRGPNGRVVGLVSAHLAASVAEWVSVVAVLVHAFERGGAQLTGLVSLAVLAAAFVAVPAAAWVVEAFPPLVVRRTGLGLQVLGYGVAVVAASRQAPVAVVLVATLVALVALGTLRPTGAVLLPALVRTTEELTRGSLWLTQADGLSVLLGPLVATVLLGAGGPAAALVGSAVLVAVALVLSSFGLPVGPPADPAGAWRPASGLAGAWAAARARPWTLGVLAALAARSALLGAFDVLLVVLALDRLDLGAGGVGLLNALLGLGAVAAAVPVAAAVRRRRLARWIIVGLGLPAVLLLVMAGVPGLAVVVVVLPVLGVGTSVVNTLGGLLLQRSADPRVLGGLVAMADVVRGLGMLVGSALAQLLLAVAGIDVAVAGLGLLLALVVVASGRSFRLADRGADVPVVEMRLLQGLHLFAPLPPVTLEAVARAAVPMRVDGGTVVIRQGETGDRFYAVVEGEFAVEVDGHRVRTARRGSWFGEVALLADVARTATVTAVVEGALLAVDRQPFLVAVTGSDTSHAAAWGAIQAMPIEVPRPPTVPDVSA